MIHGGTGSAYHGASTSHQRSLTARPPEDCSECLSHEVPVSLLNLDQESNSRQQEFAPSPNRFSILAELDQSPTRTRWAFDFIQTPRTGSRRRGKRGGKESKTGHGEKWSGERRSDSYGPLCGRFAEHHLDDVRSKTKAPPTAQNIAVPQSSFTFSANKPRPICMPSFKHNSDWSSPANVAKITGHERTNLLQLQERRSIQPNPMVPMEVKGPKRKESRFFPLSAFLATPEPAGHRSSSAATSSLAVGSRAPTRKQCSATTATRAQEAAVSAACRALATQKQILPLSTTTLGAHSLRSSPQSSPCSPSPVARLALPRHSSPMPPSPPLVVAAPRSPTSPALTSSPPAPTLQASTLTSSSSVISVPPSVTSSPSFISFQQNIPQPLKAPAPLPPRPNLTLASSPASVEKANQEDSELISLLAVVTAPIASSRPFITPPKPSPAVVPKPLFKQPQLKPIAPAEPITKPSNVAPMNSTAQQELVDFLKLGHADPCWCTSHGPNQPQSYSSAATIDIPTLPSQTQMTKLVKRNFEEAELENPVEIDSIPLSPSSFGSDFGFEDLGSTVASITLANNEEQDWTILSPGLPEDLISLSSSSDLMSPISLVAYPSPPLTPLCTPPLAQPEALGTPDPQAPKANASISSPWRSLPQSPVSQEQCQRCSRRTCVCAAANTSAVEWPTLQQAMSMK